MPAPRTIVGLALLAGCGASRWHPADPNDPDRMVCCTGTITAIRTETDGVVGIDVKPRASSAKLLSPGQAVVTCELPPHARAPFTRLLADLRAGGEVEICGYWVTDDQRPGLRLIRSITSIDPFPEAER